MEEIAKEILAKAAQGDMGAFEKIYRSVSGFVYTVALRITNHSQSAEDVTQEVFMKIYHNLKQFEFRSSFKTWVYRITVNTALNSMRGRRKETSFDDHYEHRLQSELSRHDDYNMDKEERNKYLAALLNKLNPEQKACIVLREIEGLSYKEIAVALRIKINTVRSRIKRARLSLLALAQEAR